jgi:IS5 family transposase
MTNTKKKPVQLGLFAPASKTIPLKIDTEHSMVRLSRVLYWEDLMEVAERIRGTKVKSPAGAKPHLRANLGAVVVRAMKSCDLRTASDLIANYVPARVLCDLQDSDWTPDFRTLSDFEIMLGQDGLSEINTIVLLAAKKHGFADIKGLCADTTAQEAKIPYPNEVGLMRSFADSVKKGIGALGKAGQSFGRKITETVTKVKKLVRTHRLFAKTKEKKREVEKQLSALTKQLNAAVAGLVANFEVDRKEALDGRQLHTAERLAELNRTMDRLLPQIDYYIRKGKVAKDKIVSLFMPDIRAIVRGKSGKKVEFGIKWGINQIRGGYISLFLMTAKGGEADWAVEAIRHHQELFGKSPRDFGYDRGGWSKKHLEQMKELGVKNIAVAPKGKAQWRVSDACKERMVPERAQVEGKIGTVKRIGFNKPEAKTQAGMHRAARRAELRFNLTKFLKDLAKNGAVAAAT